SLPRSAPARLFDAVGRGFIPGIKSQESAWALAPDVCSSAKLFGAVGQGFIPGTMSQESAWASAPEVCSSAKLEPEGGGGFNPRIKPQERSWALAPEEGPLAPPSCSAKYAGPNSRRKISCA